MLGEGTRPECSRKREGNEGKNLKGGGACGGQCGRKEDRK